MTSSVYLVNASINSGTPVKVHTGNVTVDWRNNTEYKPNTGKVGSSYTPGDVNKNSIENVRYEINPFWINGDSGSMTQALMIAFAVNAADGTSSTQTYLQVEYNNGTKLYASDATSTSIPVEVESFRLPINVQDSKDARIITGSITLRETPSP